MLLVYGIIIGVVGTMVFIHGLETRKAYREYNKSMNELFGTDPKTRWHL